MSRTRSISLDVDNGSLKFQITLVNACYTCMEYGRIKRNYEKNDEGQCVECENVRWNLTENGKKILGIIRYFKHVGNDDLRIDLEDLQDSDSFGYGYRP